MLSQRELKIWLSRELPRGTKLMLLLSSFDAPASVKQIVEQAKRVGLHIGPKWNPSTALVRLNGRVIRTPDGWELAERGAQELRTLGVGISVGAEKVAFDLRAHLEQVRDPEVREYVKEAVGCFESHHYRAAVVMSWLAAVSVLYGEVIKSHLPAFNKNAHEFDSRWKRAASKDDLTRMKESDFLDRLAAISVLGKNVKEELQAALRLRNACGHPNSLTIGSNAVASHIEILILNVFAKFS